MIIIHLKTLEAVLKAMLYPQSYIGIAYKDEKDSEKDFNEIKAIIDNHAIIKEEIKTIDDTVIRFKNGSYIEVLKPKKEEDIIRGKRTNISHWLYDFEYCGISDEDFDKVIKPFLKNKQ